jgi:hypothetical protein
MAEIKRIRMARNYDLAEAIFNHEKAGYNSAGYSFAWVKRN